LALPGKGLKKILSLNKEVSGPGLENVVKVNFRIIERKDRLG
jgi:hypothetical protein